MGARTTIVQHTLVEEQEWQAFGQHDVDEKVLWVQGRGRAALLHIRPGAAVESHTHPREIHHVWVVSGSCVLGGHAAYSGSYLFVPAGAEHGARAGVEGCTLFYLVLPANEE